MRAFVALLLLLMVFSAGSPAEAPTGDRAAKKKLQAINKELQESKQKLRKTKKEERAVLGRLAVIKKDLKNTKRALSRAQNKIKTNAAQVGMLRSELRGKRGDLQEKEEKLKRRIKETYKSSSLNYLELLMASRSMSDFFNRLYFFGKIVKNDALLVQGVREDVAYVKQKKRALESKTKEIKKTAKEVAEKKEEISNKAKEKEKLYKALQRRRKEYEAHVAELEKSSKDLEVVILKKVAGHKGGKVRGTGVISWPLRGRITSPFGYRRHPLWGGRNFHTGIDIAGKNGTPVKAADAGEVIFAGWWDGYGKAVVIDHGRQVTTVYAHLSRIYRKTGAVVTKGQIVGLVGTTGYSTGPHLHFEVRKKGKPVNPMGYLK